MSLIRQEAKGKALKEKMERVASFVLIQVAGKNHKVRRSVVAIPH